MAKYQITTDQGVFEVEAEGDPTEDQLRQAVIAQMGAGQEAPAAPAANPANPRGITTVGQSYPDESAAFSAFASPAGVAPVAGLARYGAPLLQPQGGPGGSAASAAGEKLAQFIEGTDDPSAVTRAAITGFPTLGGARGVWAGIKEALQLGGAGLAAEQIGTIQKNAAETGQIKPAGPTESGMSTALPAILGLLGRGVGRGAGAATGNVAPEELARVRELVANNTNKDAVLASMQAKGAAAVPSSVNPSFKNKALESIAGIQGAERAIAERNQPLFNAMGRREAGLAPLEPINERTLAAARNDIASDSYKPIRDAGLGDLLDNWRSASTKLKEADAKIAGGKFTTGRGADVDVAEKELADAAQRLDIAAKTAGLTGDIEAAKVAFAKNYDVKGAVLPGTDEVRPELLGAGQADIGPLSGELEEMVKFQNAFGRSSKNPLKMASAPGVAGQGAALVAGGGDPTKTAAMSGGIPLVREYVQKLLASPEYQAKNAVRNYTPSTSADPRLTAIIQRILLQEEAARSRQ